MTRTLSLLTIVLALAGCASDPVHYHTLSAPAAARAAGQSAPFAIDVLAVGIPAQLDQQQLVVRQGATSLVVQDGERWSGPYADEIRNALAAQLAASLNAQDMSGLGRVDGQPLLRIQVQVRRFDAWVGEKVSLEATWRLHFADADAKARLVCTSRFEAPARGGYPAVVQAQQLVLGKLAADIAAGARAWDGAQTACIKGI
ncbi:PqiC family protein [Massilia sp. S19_KUP03_FR1]|uniref:PqiC family protein n=1 Tax=Massilia sp. S19_KUP03_FR1 TaxID=3025503 RepID=UPI002FCD9EF3